MMAEIALCVWLIKTALEKPQDIVHQQRSDDDRQSVKASY